MRGVLGLDDPLGARDGPAVQVMGNTVGRLYTYLRSALEFWGVGKFQQLR